MIRFSKYHQPRKYLWSYLKVIKAMAEYFDHPTFTLKNGEFFKFFNISGKQADLTRLHNIHEGERCFIIGNGPSLNKMDLDFLSGDITIGCNGIYKKFTNKFSCRYMVFEDVVQTEIRGREIASLENVTKLAALYNAYSFPIKNDMLYFNAPSVIRPGNVSMKEGVYPLFSEDFSSVVYLGRTVTYIMLQLAFFMGCNPVYLVGVDHSYGPLGDIYPPGKIKITNENYHLVQQCHFDSHYYQVGDVIGVPHVKLQEEAYRKALSVYQARGRSIFNAGVDSKLNVFEFVEYNSLF